jgi:hypothetical protein
MFAWLFSSPINVLASIILGFLALVIAWIVFSSLFFGAVLALGSLLPDANPARVKPASASLDECKALGPYTGKTPYLWLTLAGVLFVAIFILALIGG